MTEKKDIVESLINTVQNLEKDFSKMKEEFEIFKNSKQNTENQLGTNFHEITEKVLQEEDEEIMDENLRVDNSDNISNKELNTEEFVEDNNEENISQDELESRENIDSGKNDKEELMQSNTDNLENELHLEQEKLSSQNETCIENTEELENSENNSQMNSENDSENDSENIYNDDIQDYGDTQNRKIKNTKKKRKYCSKNLQSRKKIRELYSDLRNGLEKSC
jgi:hypothetical protein